MYVACLSHFIAIIQLVLCTSIGEGVENQCVVRKKLKFRLVIQAVFSWGI